MPRLQQLAYFGDVGTATPYYNRLRSRQRGTTKLLSDASSMQSTTRVLGSHDKTLYPLIISSYGGKGEVYDSSQAVRLDLWLWPAEIAYVRLRRCHSTSPRTQYMNDDLHYLRWVSYPQKYPG